MGNNLVFIEHLFCAKNCAKSFLNINLAFNLYKNLEREEQREFPFYLQSTQAWEGLRLALNTLSWDGQSRVRTQVCVAPSPSSPHTAFSKTSVQATSKCLHVVFWRRCWKPERSRQRKTNKKLQKSNGLGRRPGEAAFFGRASKAGIWDQARGRGAAGGPLGGGEPVHGRIQSRMESGWPEGSQP